ncbi:MAG: hypothetical protein P1V51_17035 [Deltaproteobacteria bacterium]|nr:hypothetical protein [Deltaproteobacteria bacterium]
MTTHPDILELELSRTGEASPATEQHLEACEACRAVLAELQSLEAGLMDEVPEIPIPEAVDRAVAAAADAAVARAEAQRVESDDARMAELIRPSVFRRLLPYMGAASAAAIMMITLTSVFGDNVRALFGASADALAGNEYREPMAGVSGQALEGHKSLGDFSENNGPSEGFGGELHKGLEIYEEDGSPAADWPVGVEIVEEAWRLTWTPDGSRSGALEVTLGLPAGTQPGPLKALHEGDTARQALLPVIGSEQRLRVWVVRTTPSQAPLEVRVQVEGPAGTPRILSASFTPTGGAPDPVTPGLGPG